MSKNKQYRRKQVKQRKAKRRPPRAPYILGAPRCACGQHMEQVKQDGETTWLCRECQSWEAAR